MMQIYGENFQNPLEAKNKAELKKNQLNKTTVAQVFTSLCPASLNEALLVFRPLLTVLYIDVNVNFKFKFNG